MANMSDKRVRKQIYNISKMLNDLSKHLEILDENQSYVDSEAFQMYKLSKALLDRYDLHDLNK